MKIMRMGSILPSRAGREVRAAPPPPGQQTHSHETPSIVAKKAVALGMIGALTPLSAYATPPVILEGISKDLVHMAGVVVLYGIIPGAYRLGRELRGTSDQPHPQIVEWVSRVRDLAVPALSVVSVLARPDRAVLGSIPEILGTLLATLHWLHRCRKAT
jgi:hypothetical protein